MVGKSLMKRETVTLVSGAMHFITRPQEQLKFKSGCRYLGLKLLCVHTSVPTGLIFFSANQWFIGARANNFLAIW